MRREHDESPGETISNNAIFLGVLTVLGFLVLALTLVEMFARVVIFP